jgi:hypothetical protein
MPMTDDDLVRQLDSVPLVESPDFRDAVMGRVKRGAGWAPATSRRYIDRRLVLGLAWAAAVAIVVGVGLWRSPQPRPQSAAATMSQSELSVVQNGDRWLVKANVKGDLEWDQTKLSKVDTLSDGTVVLQRKPGAAGSAEIRLHVAGGEVLKTSIRVD